MVELDQIAETVHEAIRAWSRANGQAPQPSWADAPDWMKASTRESVQFVIDHPGAGAESQHQQWLEQKLRDGWTYGPVKSEQDRTHPMMVPFADLADAERKKDILVRAVVLALI